uniref:Uncharacterized protein n=1 Tax=Anser cygnoides TaxID=8845 RepID=A0A8B9E2D6_ANSCY
MKPCIAYRISKTNTKKMGKYTMGHTKQLVQYNCCFASIIPTFIKKKGPNGNS